MHAKTAIDAAMLTRDAFFVHNLVRIRGTVGADRSKTASSIPIKERTLSIKGE